MLYWGVSGDGTDWSTGNLEFGLLALNAWDDYRNIVGG